MLGEGGFTHQPPSPKPPSPTGGNNNETQPDFADINLLPTKNGLDFGVHLRSLLEFVTTTVPQDHFN
jgi:hypothetical protein